MDPNRKRKGITKAKRVAKIWKQQDMLLDEEEFMRSHLKNRKKCSCDMCCNRRHAKRGRKKQKYLTRQEKEAVRRMREDIEDLKNGTED
jgi:hypothetical protein